MRLQRLIIGVFAILVFFTAQNAKANSISVNFGNDLGASIRFDGAGHFTFTDLGTDFNIKAPTVDPLLVGLHGAISGTFTVGAISTAGGVQAASVTSPDGLFSIDDGHGFSFTASLNWNDIRQGVGPDQLNISSAVNLKNFQYDGLNASLRQLKDAGEGAISLNFTMGGLPNTQTLTYLTTSNVVKTAAYTGVLLVATPEPSSLLLLLGSGLVWLALFGRFWVSGKQN